MAAVVEEARTMVAEAVTAAVVEEARTVVAGAVLAAVGEARTEVVHTDTKFPATARPRIWGGFFLCWVFFVMVLLATLWRQHVFSTVTDLGPFLIGHTGKPR